MVFPVAPPDGTRHVKGGDRYTYQAADNAWRRWDTGSINLSGAGSPMDGVTDDGPLLQAFIDAKYAAGFRVFVFDPGTDWVISTEILFDGYSDLTFIAYGARIQHGASADFAMFKFLRCEGVTWRGGYITGRRDFSLGANWNDDGERFMHFRSGSKDLTIQNVTFDSFGAAALSITAENTLFADLPSPTPVNSRVFLENIRVIRSYMLFVTRGGGFNAVIANNIHFERCASGLKIDGEQERGPEQSNEHADYGPMANYVVSNVTGYDMFTNNAVDGAAHLVIVTENIQGNIDVSGCQLENSDGVGLFSVTRGQTNKMAMNIRFRDSQCRNITNNLNAINKAITLRGAENVTFSGVDLFDCGIFATHDGTTTTRSSFSLEGCNIWGGEIKTFHADINARNTHFYENGSGQAAPVNLVHATDSFTTNACWWDPTYTTRFFGGGSTYLSGPGDWQGPGALPGVGTFTGDGTTAQFDLVHNLGKGAVAVALHNTTTNEVNPPGGPGITYVDDNTTRLTYATAPTAGHVYNWSAT